MSSQSRPCQAQLSGFSEASLQQQQLAKRGGPGSVTGDILLTDLVMSRKVGSVVLSLSRLQVSSTLSLTESQFRPHPSHDCLITCSSKRGGPGRVTGDILLTDLQLSAKGVLVLKVGYHRY